METKGKLIKCNRCSNRLFLKYEGTGETDGGYTKWDKFEQLPRSWLYETQIGYLCHDCAKKFREFATDFVHGNTALSWNTAIYKEPLGVEYCHGSLYLIKEANDE